MGWILPSISLNGSSEPSAASLYIVLNTQVPFSSHFPSRHTYTCKVSPRLDFNSASTASIRRQAQNNMEADGEPNEQDWVKHKTAIWRMFIVQEMQMTDVLVELQKLGLSAT